MPVGRPAVSMRLRVLKAAGLASDQAAGNRAVDHLEPEALRQLRDHLDWYWERSLAAYQRAAEARAREQNMTAGHEIVVAKTVRVNAPVAVAFEVFAGQQWWPVDTHHLAEPPGREVALEPFEGGRWYERAADGTETDWGTVLAWQPPYRLLLTWQVSPRWTYQRDQAAARRSRSRSPRRARTPPASTLPTGTSNATALMPSGCAGSCTERAANR